MNTARLGDLTMGVCKVHGKQKGTIISASPDVFCNGKGVARLGDMVKAACGHTATIITCSPDTNCNGKGVARLGDKVRSDVYDATIITGSEDTITN